MAFLSHPALSLFRRGSLWAVWLCATLLLALAVEIAAVSLDRSLLLTIVLSAAGIWLAGGLIGTVLVILDRPD
jgi:hypothetical protein